MAIKIGNKTIATTAETLNLVAGENIEIVSNEDGSKTINATGASSGLESSMKLEYNSGSGTMNRTFSEVLAHLEQGGSAHIDLYGYIAPLSTYDSSKITFRAFSMSDDSNNNPGVIMEALYTFYSDDTAEYKSSIVGQLMEGSNITLNYTTGMGYTISAKDTKYTAGENITISSNNVISASASSSVTFVDWSV